MTSDRYVTAAMPLCTAVLLTLLVYSYKAARSSSLCEDIALLVAVTVAAVRGEELLAADCTKQDE
jgi:hypothetical protein